MQQHIAPQVLTVNGKPAPCECTKDVVCAYCVQANLILWERAEAENNKAQISLLSDAKKYGQRRLARNLGVPVQTVSNWIKKEKIPEKYVSQVREVVNF
jgi:DNA invertase Pin-like site-specific DNA recombinase